MGRVSVVSCEKATRVKYEWRRCSAGGGEEKLPRAVVSTHRETCPGASSGCKTTSMSMSGYEPEVATRPDAGAALQECGAVTLRHVLSKLAEQAG